MKKSNNPSIGVLGLWHLGCVYAASFAKKGVEVYGYDFDKDIVNNLKKNIPPLFEPDLEKILDEFNNKNLHFTTSVKEFFEKKDYIFITYDVPVDNNDRIQIDLINKTFAILPKYVSAHTTIVISSQIPVGTSRRLVNLLKKNGFDNPKVIYFPENLRLGKAFTSFLSADRIVLGSDSAEALDNFKKDFSFFKCPFITMGLESAEMVKHALNCYLATCISFSSELSDLSEKIGANMSDVVKALKTDKRISPFAPINPGLGFAGGTLGRDIQSLRKLAKDTKYEPKLLNAVYAVNQDRLPMLLAKINSLYPSLKGKSVGILGLTYKPQTSTLRRSISLELANQLHSRGSLIKAFDPVIKSQIGSYEYIKVCADANSFFQGLDMVILMTEWPEFLNLNLKKLSPLMKNRVIIDTKNFLDSKTYEKSGFNYIGMGFNK